MNGDPPGPQVHGSTSAADESSDPKPSGAVIPDVVREEVRKQLPSATHAVGVQFAMGASPNAFIDKLQPDHIDKVLDYTREDKTQEHHRLIIYFAGGLFTFVVLCILFVWADKDAILEKLVAAFIGFIGGFGVGKWTGK